MPFTTFNSRQTGLGSFGFAVGSSAIGLTCMATVAGAGNPLVKRTTDDWVSPETTVLVTPDANGHLCQQGIDLGGGVCLVNVRSNTGGTGRTLNVYRSTDSGSNWTLAQALLTFDIGADVLMRMSPFAILGNGNVLINVGYNDFLGASIAVSNVFQSTDSGATWTSIADLVAQGVFDPLNPLTADGDGFLDLIVLDDGTTVIGTFLNQVWRSTDSGATWTLVATGTLNAAVTSAVLCDLGGGSVLALAMVTPAGTLRVYRTDDSGATWAQVGTIASANWTSNSRGRQLAKKYDEGSAFAILDDNTNANVPTVYYTTDSGATWTKAFASSGTVSGTALILPSDSHPGFFGSGTFWHDPADVFGGDLLNPCVNVGTGRLYAAFAQTDGTMAAFLSTDEGLTWTQVADIPDVRGAATPPTSKLRSPTDGQLLLGLKGDVSGKLIARSLDAGATWTGVLDLAGDNVINNFVVLEEPETSQSSLSVAPPINPLFTADSEHKSVQVNVHDNTIFFITNKVGADMTLINDAGSPLVIVTTGLVLSKANAVLFGHYLGWTLQGEDPPYRIETVEMEAAVTREWDTKP